MIVLPNIWFCKVMPKLTLINSRLEIPHTDYVVRCNTVPNNKINANMHTLIRIWSPLKIPRHWSRARQLLSRVNLTGFTSLTSVQNKKYLSSKQKQQQQQQHSHNTQTHAHANFFKNWLCPNFSHSPNIKVAQIWGVGVVSLILLLRSGQKNLPKIGQSVVFV